MVAFSQPLTGVWGSQNHRTVGVGRDLCRSSSAGPLPKRAKHCVFSWPWPCRCQRRRVAGASLCCSATAASPPASPLPPPWQPGQSRRVHWHCFTLLTVGFLCFSSSLFFFFSCVHIMCVCVKVVVSKTSLFIDDVITIVLFFWLINCLLSLLCMPAKISHTSSWKGYEETSN